MPLRVDNTDNQSAILSAIEIRKSFGSNEVLKGISMEARRGDVIAIIGSSGSGKSTFLRCLNLLESPDAGELSVRGESISHPGAARRSSASDEKKQIRALRRKVSMVFQGFYLWSHMTALQNVMEAPMRIRKVSKAEAAEQASALLGKVGLADRAHHYPNELSGGQQQRVAIARALAADPEVILFDEPTSALDPELVGEVLRVMTNLAAEGRTMLVVTHEMSFARRVANRVVFFHQGKIEEEGHPDQVLVNPRSERLAEFLASYHSAQDAPAVRPQST
ncbi:ATP-binding protein [Burkholderia aenigmatica]|uniref:ATP-binding protein n=1 Tax=Burkholderia aenigmatica TaxID=2015348 RepID=A0A6P2I721_9BURK|nr:amino acid ABC transporter ATP-binding protein [Burkholderia aenigmatica]VWB26585.1 ATP-binding protein [Burkholderia aenigmatica]